MMPSAAPLFVHSDTGRGMIVAKRCGAKIDPRALQQSLVDFLATQVDDGRRGLVFPAFNYDYGSTRVFDMDNDPAQVGSLVEWLRKTGEMRRTAVPFFSFLSERDLGIDTSGPVNPFDTASGFQWLVDHDASLVMYGAPMHSLTFIHYVEEMAGGPVYRYTKSFPGEVHSAKGKEHCDFAMHVRPMGVHMDYDWPRLVADLRDQGILKHAEMAPDFQWLTARTLLEYWGSRIAEDPFFLLDAQSRSYFERATNNGRSRVQLTDFENE